MLGFLFSSFEYMEEESDGLLPSWGHKELDAHIDLTPAIPFNSPDILWNIFVEGDIIGDAETIHISKYMCPLNWND